MASYNKHVEMEPIYKVAIKKHRFASTLLYKVYPQEISDYYQRWIIIDSRYPRKLIN